MVLKSASRNHPDRTAGCFTIYGIYNYLAQDMHFSFLFTVVAILTTSMSVSACAGENGVCGSSSAAGDTCCTGLTCKLASQRRRSTLVLPLVTFLIGLEY
ncbi:hypothetical protein BDR03DRAFT_153253 [Suillus americanus]|nr:hypothetical protein BDR03DRAFT_153253 [Suillus americanus]